MANVDSGAVRPDDDELLGSGRRPAHARGPPECPVRPFFSTGDEPGAGITFKDFTPLDAGGPLTIDALMRDEVQVGLLFSTDPSIEQHGFVRLTDDRRLMDAENITPVIRTEKLNDEIRGLLDAVSARLSSEEMTELVGQVGSTDGRCRRRHRFPDRNDLLLRSRAGVSG